MNPRIDQKTVVKLVETTYTKPQLIRRVRVLRDFTYFRLFNLTPEQIKLPLASQIQLFLALHQKDLLELNLLRQEGNWMISLGEDFFSEINQSNNTNFFKQLEDITSQLQPIIIYLPIELPEKNQFELGQWLKTNVGKSSLYEVNFNGELIGGCAISFNGRFKDYSLRAKINDNRAEIINSLKTYKH